MVLWLRTLALEGFTCKTLSAGCYYRNGRGTGVGIAVLVSENQKGMQCLQITELSQK